MNKIIFCLILSFLHLSNLKADHIVGGELQLTHISGNSYTLALNFYFNDITGNPAAKDPSVDISAFSKNSNTFLTTFYVPLFSDNFVSNINNNACPDANVRTRIIRYQTTIQLDAATFNDPSGFYFSWERCCRNSTINNIQNPGNTGQVFYLEFPPLNIVNSSPVFRSLQNIFGCIGQPFYFDFGANDPDGDSLLYRLRTPLKGHSDINNVIPTGLSAPYDSIDWAASYNVSSQIRGNPALQINKNTGELFVVPSQVGLFVFAVQCEEYRKGIKIGEVRREYQIYIHGCPSAYAPQLKLKKPDNTYYQKGDTLKINMRSSACYHLSATDSTWTSLHSPEQISLSMINQAKPNISLSVDSLSFRINAANDTGKTNICITAICTNGKFNYSGLYKYTIIAKDGTCPSPLTDTIDMIFFIIPDTNHAPHIFPAPKSRSVSLYVGDSYSLNIYGTDKDSPDHLNLIAYADGFNLSDAGMSFNNVSGNDSLASLFSWTPSCQNLKATLNYPLKFIISDDHCVTPGSDTMEINFTLADHYYPFTFNPPNLFTPDNDGHNDFFEISDLPKDYCDNYYVKLEIYNRWGSKVFETHERNFKWSGEKETDGIYYYVVKYSNEVFKGWVEIIR
jgi:gliding motility-associated-like protein